MTTHKSDPSPELQEAYNRMQDRSLAARLENSEQHVKDLHIVVDTKQRHIDDLKGENERLQAILRDMTEQRNTLRMIQESRDCQQAGIESKIVNELRKHCQLLINENEELKAKIKSISTEEPFCPGDRIDVPYTWNEELKFFRRNPLCRLIAKVCRQKLNA